MTPVSALLGIGETLIDRLIPDKSKRAEALERLAEMEQEGELKLLIGQLEINKVEAAHESLFVSGWRPAVGWICALALGYHFIVVPFVNIWVDMPSVEVESLYPILMGMLGLGGLRTAEKFKNVARDE